MGESKKPKNTNGTGSLYKVITLSGERWQSSHTIGLDGNRKPIRIIGSGKTPAEARRHRGVNIQKYYQRQGTINQSADAPALRPTEQKLTVAAWL